MPISISEVPSGPRQGHAASLKDAIARAAREVGFDVVRFTGADAPEGAGPALDAFLAQGLHGDMAWLETTRERRKDPKALWPEARSIIMLGLSYAPNREPLAALAMRSRGAISVYAQGSDYHDLIKSKLKALGARVQALVESEVKVFVDTAPVMEKPLAAKAGLGWQGKHTNLVSRDFGSWLFLGSIFTTAAIEPDFPETDHCGACTRCLEICPTDAFIAPYRLDARACISYLTIEHKGHIAPKFRAAMGNRIFGCDDCLAVCPWNKFATAGHEAKLAARAGSDNPPLAELLDLDDARFRDRFRGTPIKRAGRDRFLRNVLIAAGNASDASLLPKVERHLADPSPLVRAMAVWALSQLAPDCYRTLAPSRRAAETDPDVAKEWAGADA